MAKEENKLDRIFKGLIFLGIFGVLDLILFGVFGYAGNFVKNFLIGIFGYAIYGYSIALTVMSLFILLGFKPKVPFKVTLNYLMILLVIICIGHLVTYRENTNLNYSEYLSAIYNDHDTLAGVVIGAIMYPFAKLYTFGVVLFSLLLVGFVALCIINQLDFEIGLKLKSFSHKKNKKADVGYTQQYVTNNNYQTNEYKEPEAEFYNGDVNGKLFTNDKSKFKRRHSSDYELEPIEAIGAGDGSVNLSSEDQDDIISGLNIDPGDVDTEIELAKQRAQMFAEASPIIPIDPIQQQQPVQPVQEEIDFSSLMSTPTVEESEPLKPYVPSKEDSIYFNSYRRKQVDNEENNKKEDESNTTSYTPSSNSYNNYYASSVNNDDKKEEEVFNDLPKTPVNADSDSIEEDVFSDLMKKISNDIESQETQQNNVVEEEQPDFLSDKELDVNTDVEEDVKEEQPIKPEPPVQPVVQPQPIQPQPIIPPRPVVPVQPVVQRPVEPVKPVEPPKPVEKPKPVIKPYVKPEYDLLNDYKSVDDDTDYTEKAESMKTWLASLKINIEIIDIIKGPTFTRIVFKPEVGTQLKKITGCEEDIKASLAAESVRLLAPIPGTSYCGVEIPSVKRGMVGLKEVITTQQYQDAIKKPTGLTFAFGKDVENRPYFYDLTKAPHILISGGTGSGKSVAINVLICSLLYRYSPQELRFIMVDPKMVEFADYEGMPHMIMPNIITDPIKANNAMQWACDEMDRRYTLLRDARVRKIDEYNDLPEVKADPTLKLPCIVIIIDEYNEVMLSSIGKQFDLNIKRLTQKARAAGIHLILATQNPTVDVVTSTIKSNVPCRMGLRVTSAAASMVVLGSPGAEKLLGWGDMLFLDPSAGALKRVQGACIDEKEVKRVVDYVKGHNLAYFDESIGNTIMKEPEPEINEDDFQPKQMSMFPDELCVRSLEMCVQYQQVSTSFLQRKFSVGYSRAAKIVDWMMDNGYAKLDGNKKVVTVGMDEVEKLKSLDDIQPTQGIDGN